MGWGFEDDASEAQITEANALTIIASELRLLRKTIQDSFTDGTLAQIADGCTEISREYEGSITESLAEMAKALGMLAR